MHHLRTEITIDAPLDAVWDALTDLPGWESWNPSFHDIRGQIVAGARLSFRVGPDSRMRIRPRVIEVADRRTFAWRGHLFGVPGLFDGEHRFTLAPTAGGGTHLVQEERFAGVLRKLVLRRIGNDVAASFAAMNAALKAHLERSKTPERV